MVLLSKYVQHLPTLHPFLFISPMQAPRVLLRLPPWPPNWPACSSLVSLQCILNTAATGSPLKDPQNNTCHTALTPNSFQLESKLPIMPAGYPCLVLMSPWAWPCPSHSLSSSYLASSVLLQHGWLVLTTGCVHWLPLLLGNIHMACSLSSASSPFHKVTFFKYLPWPRVLNFPPTLGSLSLPLFPPVLFVTFHNNIFHLFMWFVVCINPRK